MKCRYWLGRFRSPDFKVASAGLDFIDWHKYRDRVNCNVDEGVGRCDSNSE